ncbi:MAG: hypothetical protein SOY97_01485 [Candidatus Metalachnospira sp.]|nr:hypothetical protein [Candidatus Metalachnospira sp.]
MKLRKKRIFIITAAAVIACAATAAAAIRYLAPKEIAQSVSDNSLARAFESKDAVEVNETQEYGGYRVTFLGVISGSGLSDFTASADGVELEDRTYAVTAIEKSDGTPMPSASDDNYGEVSFLVSPLIKGLNPVNFNAFTMNGGYTDIVKDGILYRLAECDNVEMFADRGAYLCVSTSMSYDINAYNYDEKTGDITRNNNYDGLNALFELPLDKSRADRDEADKYIKEINSMFEGDNNTGNNNASVGDNDFIIDEYDGELIIEQA